MFILQIMRFYQVKIVVFIRINLMFKCWQKAHRCQCGFSLIELMIVVGIIGILTAIAFPKYKSFQARSRMAEAKSNLQQIYTLEEAYYLHHSQYLAFNNYGVGQCVRSTAIKQLGFELKPCSEAKFLYSVSLTPTGYLATAISGSGAANQVCPGGAANHFTIDQTGKMDKINSGC